MTATGTQLDLGALGSSSAWGYDGLVPGPTLRVRQGDTVDVELLNALPQETTVHWHGLIVPAEMDGHPHDAVAPGRSYRYDYPVIQRAGTFWYHPHPHSRTGEQVYRGLAGFFLVEDVEERSLGLPSGPYELALLLRDAAVDANGELRYRRNASGVLGEFPLVNGVEWPTHGVDAAVYRLRMLNGSNLRVFRLALSDGRPLVVIGNDGGLLERAAEAEAIDVAPAERVDVLVDLRDVPPGRRVSLRCLREQWDLVDFVVRGPGDLSQVPVLPAQLSTILPLSPADVSTTRVFAFEGNHRINDREFDMHRIDFTVPFGTVERWRFRASSNAPHPVHVHGTHFQVEARTGGRGRIFPWERGWKDTVLVDDGETVDVLIRFDAYRGLYLLHCHRLEHEDGGMMLNFAVA